MKMKNYVDAKKNNVRPMAQTLKIIGQELAADIVKDIKEQGDRLTPEARKLLNKERIKALGFTLIQGGKSEE